MNAVSIPADRKRKFLPTDFKLTGWSRLKPYFNELLRRPIDSIERLEEWMMDRNELESLIHEEINLRYLRFAQDSSQVSAKEAYNYAVQEIESKLEPIGFQLDKKLLNAPSARALPRDTFGAYLKSIQRKQKLCAQANEEVKAAIELKSRKYTEIFSGITVSIGSQKLTMQAASVLLEGNDRAYRAEVFQKMANELLKKEDVLQSLFSELLASRHQMALNAGFENFRDYQFHALNRIDYGVEECLAFQESVLQKIVPLIKRFSAFRKKSLGIEKLRPWDFQVDIKNRLALKPFQNVEELIDGTQKTLHAISPYFAECFGVVEKMDRLDLLARKDKRPGGFLMYMPQSRVPFIFSNVTRSIKDVRTLLHESGHAIHAFMMEDIAFGELRRLPSEVAELAAMTMELLGMEHWEVFFKDAEQLEQAKTWQLLKVLEVLPWIAGVDRFQHWLYTNPNHTVEERGEKWVEIHQDYCLPEVDWTGFEEYQKAIWLNQLHLFERPFYYIEYGFAQMGAISLWQQYQDDPDQMLECFSDALKLGNTRSVTEIYKIAGIPFDWSAEYLGQLADRVLGDLQNILGSEL